MSTPPTSFSAYLESQGTAGNSPNGWALCDGILTATPNGIMITDRAGTIVWTNPAFTLLSGYTAAEVIGKNPRELFNTGQQSSEIYQRLWETILAGRTWKGELLNRRKDGSRYHEEMTITPHSDDCGRITHFIAIKTDRTEKWENLAATQRNEERYRLLFDNNPLPMWVYHTETRRFLAVNDAAIQHYGYTRQEFSAMSIDDIQPAPNSPPFSQPHRESTLPKIPSLKQAHLRKDGSIIYVDTIIRPVVFEGSPAHLVLAADITEQKVLEEKFLHAQRLESIGMLAAGIAHDLNNVLAPIVLASEFVRYESTTPSIHRSLDIIIQSAGRGTSLVKQILGFARVATGELLPTQLKHILRDIEDIIRDTFPKSIVLKQEIPSELWSVMGSATQFHQVVLNLCINARDAMPEGGVLHLSASNHYYNAGALQRFPGAQPGPWVVLEVSDTGPGIAPEVLPHIWEPFFTTKDLGKGTGLGLSTVRGIVTSHKGFIEVLTGTGKGTTFRVMLPALDTLEPAKTVIVPTALYSGRQELIMVVEDNTLIRESVGELLRKWNYRTVSFPDGSEAVAYFRDAEKEIALVLTDVDMPRLGGNALAREIKRLNPGTKLIAMSGLSLSDPTGPAEESLPMLADAFIAKPFRPEDLLQLIAKLVRPTG